MQTINAEHNGTHVLARNFLSGFCSAAMDCNRWQSYSFLIYPLSGVSRIQFIVADCGIVEFLWQMATLQWKSAQTLIRLDSYLSLSTFISVVNFSILCWVQGASYAQAFVTLCCSAVILQGEYATALRVHALSSTDAWCLEYLKRFRRSRRSYYFRWNAVLLGGASVKTNPWNIVFFLGIYILFFEYCMAQESYSK